MRVTASIDSSSEALVKVRTGGAPIQSLTRASPACQAAARLFRYRDHLRSVGRTPRTARVPLDPLPLTGTNIPNLGSSRGPRGGFRPHRLAIALRPPGPVNSILILSLRLLYVSDRSLKEVVKKGSGLS